MERAGDRRTTPSFSPAVSAGLVAIFFLFQICAASSSERIVARTKFGDVIWGTKGFIDTSPPTLRLKTADGVREFSNRIAWDGTSPNSTVAAQAESEDNVALLLRSDSTNCSARFQILLLARSRREDSIRALPSQNFGICNEAQSTIELINHKTSSGDEVIRGVMATLPDALGQHQFFVVPHNSELAASSANGFERGRKFIPSRTSAPCLSGICLGDSITTHAHSVNWNLPPTKITVGNSPFSELYRIQDRIIGLPENSGANIYLSNRTPRNLLFNSDFYKRYPSFRDFEGEIIEPDGAMVRVDGPFIYTLSDPGIVFCRNIFFRAGFTSTNGYPTWVSFRPDKDGVPRVVELIRQYHLPNRQSVDATTLSIRKEYPFLPAARSNVDDWKDGPWGGKYQFVDYGIDNELRLAFTLYENGATDEQLSAKPVCPQPQIRSTID